MEKRKAIIPVLYLLVSITYFGAIGYFFLYRKNKWADFLKFIPGKIITDIIFLLIIVPLIICIPILFLKSITIINFKFTKKFQRNFEYYYVELRDKTITTRRLMIRSLLPVFMALAFAQLILSIFGNDLLSFFHDKIIAIIMLCLIFAPVTGLLILPIWVFKDSGIIKIQKTPKERIPPELTYFGRFQHQSYKGFTGITTPLTFCFIIFIEFVKSGRIDLLIILSFPFFLVGFYMPLLLSYEKKIKKLREELIIRNLNLQPLTLKIVDQNIFS